MADRDRCRDGGGHRRRRGRVPLRDPARGRRAKRRPGAVHEHRRSDAAAAHDDRTNPATPENGLPWPFYGRTLSRTRDASDLMSIHPPYKTSWSKIGGGLLEYPPAYADGILYELSDAGTATAFNVFNGHVKWRKHLRAGASLPALGSPAIGGSMIYMPAGSGLVALRRSDGQQVWRLRARWRARLRCGTARSTSASCRVRWSRSRRRPASRSGRMRPREQ